jgi:outer membrane protein, heavy metal efflux system
MTRRAAHGAIARLAAWLVLMLALATPLAAQPTPIGRAEAVRRTLTRGARLGVARADTAAAFAQLLTARAFENPVLIGEYTKSAPRYHLTADLPIDYPWLRRTRVQSAEAARQAAHYRYELERASAALDADTTYTRAAAALARSRLSRRTAQDADSLRRMAVARRDAGDASDLDVELATVSAGQQANVAAADSLELLSALLDLQTVIGLAGDDVLITPSDSLAIPPAVEDTTADGNGTAVPTSGAPPRVPLAVAAAEASLTSALFAVRAQRRSLFSSTSITAGFETGDPGGDERGILPVVGVSIPLPFLNRNQGPIALAAAERDRAHAELDLARLEASARIARATRERAIALAKVERDRRLIASADRVASLSLAAYREGASTLPNVLEAQRNAREVLAQYVDDLARAWVATAALRVYTLTPSSVTRP